MKKIYTMGRCDHSKTWNPSTLTWYYLCLSALNRNEVCKFHWNMILVTSGEERVNLFLGMFCFHTPTPHPSTLLIGLIFLIILGCFLNKLVTKRASGKFFFFFQRTMSKNWGGRNCLSGTFQSLLYHNKSNYLYENCFKNMSWKTFTFLRVNELYKQGTLTLASCLRRLKKTLFSKQLSSCIFSGTRINFVMTRQRDKICIQFFVRSLYVYFEVLKILVKAEKIHQNAAILKDDFMGKQQL